MNIDYPSAPAYYVGTHHYSFRTGEPAKILDIQTYFTPKGPRVCFHISYGDGIEDYCPLCDVDNYKILTSEEVRTRFEIK